MVKFNKSLKEYKYILAFDLAKNLTGYSLIDFVNNKIIHIGIIDTTKSTCECLWFDYANKIREAIKTSLACLDESESKYVLITKEKLPNQSGKFSSIEALQALAQCHAICDSVVYDSGIDYYDFDGVHSVSVKAYIKKQTEIEKPTKEDIRDYLANLFNYDFTGYTLDVTDSIAVAITLVNSKYNKDIAEEVKQAKKSLKQYKAKNKIQEMENKIKLLLSLVY